MGLRWEQLFQRKQREQREPGHSDAKYSRRRDHQQMVVWHNVDTITHRVVLNDQSVDTGNLAPGASSQPMAIGAAGAQYHCSIHPVMVGSVNQGTSTVAAPCQGAYCN